MMMKKRFVEVAVPLPLNKTFTYSIPESFEDFDIGTLVLVPFGKRKMTGYVVGFPEKVELKKLKSIISFKYPVPVFSKDSLDFYRKVSECYLAPLGEVIRMALPAGLDSKVEMSICLGKIQGLGLLPAREQVLIDELKRGNNIPIKAAIKKFALNSYELKNLRNKGFIEFISKPGELQIKPKFEKFAELIGNSEEFKSKSKKEKEIVDLLGRTAGKIYLNLIKESIKGFEIPLKRLVEKGVVQLSAIESERVPYLEKTVARDNEPELYEDQKNAVSAIEEKLNAGLHETFLLHGITGSGKTEVYLRVIAKVLAKGKNALALVPEIALTPQFIQRFRARFGDIISVLHSSMSKGERFDQWRKILRGDAKIVIGARSAVFAPLSNIGIVVVDEEHDHSYKQEDRIMYNAKDLAIERGKLSGAVVLLGSATPSIESYYRAKNKEYSLLTLSLRTSNFGLPEVEIVDLKMEKGKFGKKSFLSDKLLDAIRDNAKVGGKTILFLNRRGYSAFVLCTNCGSSVKCPNCSVSLKYHDREGKLICHYCGYSVDLYGFCETCGSKSLIRFGFGTEQLEKEIKSHFPDLRIERMDRDTTQKKFAHEIIIKKLERGEIDILIGTQMVSKGLDVKQVTLVGVVLADISLNIPDFRSCEKTFSLLTQVAGRSGRGALKGGVIVQTYNPEHYCIDEAKRHDFCSFYEKEIIFRRDIEYPPFVRLANIRFSSEDLKAIESASKKIKKIAEKELEQSENFKAKIEILGPSPSPLEKLKGEYRWQMLIKGKDNDTFIEYLKNLSANLKESFSKSRDISYKVDLDPQNFM